MLGDSLRSTHPIDVDVKEPEEISQIFDEISYGKGASILRMIESWMGEGAFRDGIRMYLSQFPYSNAKGADLWKKLEQASGMPVSEVMQAWIKKPGYPVVKVSIDDNKLHLSQERFFLKKTTLEGDVWPIPIVAQINGKKRNLLLREEQTTVTIDEPIYEIKVNSGQSGFYRVLYDQIGYTIIRSKFSKLDPFDRWGIIADLFAFLIAGKIDFEVYLDFVHEVLDDSDYLMVDTITGHLQFLRLLAPENPRIREIYLNYYRRQIRRLGLEPTNGEKDTDKILRGRIATGLALEDQEFAEKLAGGFGEYDRQIPDLRTAVAVAFARFYGDSGYSSLISYR